MARFQDVFSQELISLILRPKTSSKRHTARYGIPLNIRGSGGWPPGGTFNFSDQCIVDFSSRHDVSDARKIFWCLETVQTTSTRKFLRVSDGVLKLKHNKSGENRANI